MTVLASSYNNGGHDVGRGGGSGEGRRRDISRTNNPHAPSSRRPQQQQQQHSWNNRNSESSDRRYDDRERNMKRPLHYDQQQQQQQQQHQRYPSSQEEPPRQRWKHNNGHYQSSSQQQSSVSSNNNPHAQQQGKSSSLASLPPVSRRQHNDSHDRRRMNDNDSAARQDYHRRHFDLPSSSANSMTNNNNNNNNRYKEHRTNRWDHSNRNNRDPRHQQPRHSQYSHQQKPYLPPRNHGESDRQRITSKNDGRWDERRREYRPNHFQQQQQTQHQERQNSALSREQYLHRRDNGSKATNEDVSSSSDRTSHKMDGQPAAFSASIALHKQLSPSTSTSTSTSKNSDHIVTHQSKPISIDATSRPQQPSKLQSTHSSSLSILKRFVSPKASAVNTPQKSDGGVPITKNDKKLNNQSLSSSSSSVTTTITSTASTTQISSSNNICSKRRTPLKKRWIPAGSSHPSPETWGRSSEKEKHESNNINNNSGNNNSDAANDIKLTNPTCGTRQANGSLESSKHQGLSTEKKITNNGEMEQSNKSFSKTVVSTTPAEIIAEDESTQPTLEESVSEDLTNRQEEGKLTTKMPKMISSTTTSKQLTLKTMDATTATPDLTEPSTEEFELQQQQQQQQPYGRPSEICIPKAVVETVTSKRDGMDDVAAVAALPEPSTVVVSESPHSLPAAVEEEEAQVEGEQGHLDTVVTGQTKEHHDADTPSLGISHKKEGNDLYQGGKNLTHNATTSHQERPDKVQSIWTDTSKSVVIKKRECEDNVAINNTRELVVNREESNTTTPLINTLPFQEEEVVKNHTKLQQEEENPKFASTSCNWDKGVVDYDSDSSDDSTSSEEDEQEILLWAQKMFGVTPPGLIKGRNDGYEAKPQDQEEETIKSKDELDSFEDTNIASNDISMNSNWNYYGMNTTIQPTAAELVKSRNRKAARKNKKKKKKWMLKEENHMNATPLKTQGGDVGNKSPSHNVVSKKSRKKSEEQLRFESEEAKRVKKEAKALTSAEIKAILGDDEYISPTSEWVRRSSRQPCRSAINAPNVRSLTGKLRDNDADMVVLKLKKYINDPDTPKLVLDAVLDALEENTNCEALYIQNFNLGMRDKQILQLLKILQQPSCRIWCLNIGETYNVKNRTWKAFTRGLKKTKVTHMYASEHTITSEMKDSIRKTIRRNRQKHDMHVNPDNLDVIIQCTHCWWNPVNAKSLRPFLQKRGIDYILFDKEVQGLQGSTSGAKGAI